VNPGNFKVTLTGENDIEGIDVQIASDPPETSDLLLTYRETAISLRAAIDLRRQTTPAIAM
jgi:hypothetical protein